MDKLRTSNCFVVSNSIHSVNSALHDTLPRAAPRVCPYLIRHLPHPTLFEQRKLDGCINFANGMYACESRNVAIYVNSCDFKRYILILLLDWRGNSKQLLNMHIIKEIIDGMYFSRISNSVNVAIFAKIICEQNRHCRNFPTSHATSIHLGKFFRVTMTRGLR